MWPRTMCLVIRSAAITTTASTAALSTCFMVALRVRRSARDQRHEHEADDVQQDDRHHRREVERADLRDEAAEQAQGWVADVAQEPEDRVRPARVGHPHPERE